MFVIHSERTPFSWPALKFAFLRTDDSDVCSKRREPDRFSLMCQIKTVIGKILEFNVTFVFCLFKVFLHKDIKSL